MNRGKSIPFKYPKIKIKLSNIFPVRTLCKHCLTGPTYYMRYGKPLIRKVPGRGRSNYTVNQNYYKNDIPINVDLKDIFFPVKFNKFNPKVHRQNKLSRTHNFDDVIYCDCTATCWFFSDSSSSGRKEIEQRKAKNSFDKEFTF